MNHSLCFPIWSAIPFAGMLMSIATLPLIAPKFWDPNRNKVVISVLLSLPVLFVILLCSPSLLGQALVDYMSFISLLGALFVISGGIYITGAFSGTPLLNTAFLAIGAVLANLVGTTGASMLLIRPYLRANHVRQRKTHLVVFFVFIVSNAGGLLTPLGDPPLFLGFLRGVPFAWTLALFPEWLFTVGVLLVVFNVWDQYIFLREDIETPGELVRQVQPKRRVHIQGKRNVFFLFGVMLTVMLSGYWGWPKGAQAALMLLMAALSWFSTPKQIHEHNHFHWHPISEVAALFLGIFITMVPALEILNARATDIRLAEPWHFFWAAGILSSFLDNAPTYLTFAALASGLAGGSAEHLGGLIALPAGNNLLKAIACGAVFMGANTYIGNGPNFMVKSIAERSGVKMPSFLGYMVYSGLILIPIFVVVTLLFFF